MSKFAAPARCTQCPVHSLVRSKLSLRLGVPIDCAPRVRRGVAAQMNTPCRYDERMSLKEDYDYTAAVACRAHRASAYCAAHRLQLLRRTGRRRTYVLASASALCSLRCHCPPRNSTRQQNFGTAQSARIYFPVQNMRCFQYARRQTEPRTNENAAVRCCGRIDVAQS